MLRQFSWGCSPSVPRWAQEISWWLIDCFLWLMACFLLPSFPTYKQNTAIRQHGRNCIQSYDASTRVLSQIIRNCLHSLCTPHVRGTGTLTTGHIRAQPCNQGGKWLPAWGSAHTSTSALRPAFTLPCQWGGFKCPAPTRYLTLYKQKLWMMM